MQRKKAIEQLKTHGEWDVVVIGGGATGLGTALDAVTRGYSTLLLEGHDFAKGTSSRSTKLVHGGVRYLAQGYVDLVREALRERGRLARNAPHLFKTQAFIIPGEKWWTAPYYTFGLWMYDRLSGKLSIGHTRHLSQAEARKRLSGVRDDKVGAGVCYYDGQFDDARLALCLALSIVDHGGTVLNYCSVTGIDKNAAGKIDGVSCRDELTGETYQVKAKCVVNATGVFANPILGMDEVHEKPPILPSQGIHLVLDRDFLPGDDALMVPKTSDGRVLFAVPWHGKLVVGTTDTLIKEPSYEPKPLEQEIEFILNTARDYLKRVPTRADVRSVFVGLRPLAAPKDEGKSTKEVSRSHKVEVSKSGMVNIFGGKWTTYRQMAEDGVDAAIGAGLLPQKACATRELKLHGYIDANRHLDDTMAATQPPSRSWQPGTPSWPRRCIRIIRTPSRRCSGPSTRSWPCRWKTCWHGASGCCSWMQRRPRLQRLPWLRSWPPGWAGARSAKRPSWTTSSSSRSSIGWWPDRQPACGESRTPPGGDAALSAPLWGFTGRPGAVWPGRSAFHRAPGTRDGPVVPSGWGVARFCVIICRICHGFSVRADGRPYTRRCTAGAGTACWPAVGWGIPPFQEGCDGRGLSSSHPAAPLHECSGTLCFPAARVCRAPMS